MSIGKMYLSAVISEQSVTNFLQHGSVEHLFRPNEIESFKFVKEFVKQYAKLPTQETIEAHTGETLIPHKETAEYYLDLMQARHTELTCKQAMKKASDFLLPENKDPDAALKALTEAVMQLATQNYQKQIVDFRDAYDVIVPEYVQQYNAESGNRLMLGWPSFDQMSAGIVRGDLVSFVGRPAAGKALAHGTPVLMADGAFKPVEEIEVGDEVASVDGALSKVFGVYAQGERALYRVTFADGRFLDVDGDHLWQVGCKYWDGPRILTTTDMLRLRAKSSRYANTLWVPLASGEFGGTEPLLDPYLLGVLIGDGCLTKEVSFTSIDAEVVARAEKGLPPYYCLTQIRSEERAPSYRVVSSADDERVRPNVVKARLQSLGLWGCRSEGKFLPAHVFYWSRTDRLALLQGLMDTDGTVARNGHIVFGSSSQNLVDDVASLVRSLGGKALHHKPKTTTHLDHYRITIILRDPSEAFGLSRKKARCKRYTTHDPSHLRVVGVEPIGKGHATCIAVTHPSRLFIAGDYVVTHNTWQMLYAAWHGWAKAAEKKEEGSSRLFVSMEMAKLPIEQRLAAMQAKVPMSQLKHADLTTAGLKKLKKGLTEIKGYGAPFWIVDMNLAGYVEDIWMLARQLKPDAIFIDGAYLLKHPTERDRFRRVAENADLIKSELCSLVPTVCSWQFAKTASKKKKGEKVTGDDIGYSDAIYQASSIVLGLFEEESVETIKQRRIEVLKGRGGEVGQFRTNWDFNAMDFSEVVEETVQELQFV